MMWQSMGPDDEVLDDIGSFCVGVMNPHDILIIPAGYALTEKTVNTTAVGLRAPFHMVHRRERVCLNMMLEEGSGFTATLGKRRCLQLLSQEAHHPVHAQVP